MHTTEIPAPSSEGGTRAPELLIVDDEEEIRAMLRRHFTYEGFSVSLAKDGREAVQQLANKKPDIIITDINMPNMNGADLVKHVSEHHPVIHVITITGYVSPSNIIRCMNYGADTCIFKPLQDMTELDEAVDEALRSIVRWWHILGELSAQKAAS